MTDAAHAGAAAERPLAITSSARSRIVRAWLFTALSDGLFASVLGKFFLGSTVTRVWQGVAAVLIPSAFDLGTAGAAIGILMHIGVALTWSVVFFLIYERSPWIRHLVGTRYGALKVASVYGPCIWLFMSLVVIPLFLHRPPSFPPRWWVQLVGHIPFVAMPIVTQIGRDARTGVRG